MRLSLFTTFIYVAAALGQSPSMRIGEIEFFGYGGVDVQKLRAALPIHEGEEIASEKAFGDAIDSTRTAVEKIVGKFPTDVASVCCDTRGNWILFIGLSGRPISYNPVPKGSVGLPTDAMSLYERFLDAMEKAVRKGIADEEHSNGYALATEDENLRAADLAMRSYAVNHAPLLENVLKSSPDDAQRTAAAELLGFANPSQSEIDALVQATCDSKATVRNNAIRALGVLADSSPAEAREIPAQPFIDLLHSGIWTDVNKASLLLFYLTKSRNPELLAELQAHALDRLFEVARWRTNHASAALFILGRIAGIGETKLQKLVESDKRDQIITAVQTAR